MKNIPKAGLLIVTLVIPALIFVFLRFFARNHFDLPYFNPVVAQNGSVVVENGDTLYQQFREVCVPEISTAGKLTVIFRSRSLPADSLDAVFSQLQRVEALRDQETNIQLAAFLSETDSVNAGDLKARKWIVIGQQPESNFSCLQKLTNDKSEADDLILIDTKGYVRGYYNAPDAEEADRLMAEIKILKYENNEGK